MNSLYDHYMNSFTTGRRFIFLFSPEYYSGACQYFDRKHTGIMTSGVQCCLGGRGMCITIYLEKPGIAWPATTAHIPHRSIGKMLLTKPFSVGLPDLPITCPLFCHSLKSVVRQSTALTNIISPHLIRQ